jgi:chloride channel 7
VLLTATCFFFFFFLQVPRFLRLRTLFAKFFSMVLAQCAQLPVGTEGPMIHLGAIVGNGVSQAQSKELKFKVPHMKHFRNDRDKRDFITSGAGAGMAAAFNSPLGGTLFSLEEVNSLCIIFPYPPYPSLTS